MKPLPDPYPIEPLTKPPNCTITVPGSKSITNRALILAALSDKKCTLRGALWADDTQVMVDSLQKLGFEVKVEPDPAEECNRTITVAGCGGKIPATKAELYVGNAGTAARFLTALVCLGHGEYTIRGDERMSKRPMADLFLALTLLGVRFGNRGMPVTIFADGFDGLPRDASVSVDVEHSSQFATALLLIKERSGIDVRLSLDGKATKPDGYVEMTLRMIKEFTPEYIIEPDLSSASYFLGVRFVADGQVNIAGWPENSLQIDRRFPEYLKKLSDERELLTGVSRMSDLGDSILTLAICAVFGKHPLKVFEAGKLRGQESDRIQAIVTELTRVGVKVLPERVGFRVRPTDVKQLHGADIETYNDHRMAMCFAVLGLKVPGIRIKNPGCVSKTFPNFFEKLEQLRQ